MKHLSKLTVALAVMASAGASAAPLLSPDGEIAVSIDNDRLAVSHTSSGNPETLFSIGAPGVTINGSFQPVREWILTSTTAGLKTDYTMTGGKRSLCTNEYNAYTLTPEGTSPEELSMQLRIYNDGIAFRYVAGERDFVNTAAGERNFINGEATYYDIPADNNRWMQQFDVAYERFFPQETGHNQTDRHWGYPALIEFPGNVWGLFTEGGIEKWHAASNLTAAERPSVYNVTWGSDAQCRRTPWRVVILGSLGDIVESTLVTDVSPASRIQDISWIEPGAASWIYWAYNHGSKDYRIVKDYIDMAVKLKLPYVLIDWEWDVMGNGGDLNDALKYARDNGVKTLLWYNSSTAWPEAGPLYRLNRAEDREEEFSRLQEMGVSGVKIDFFAGDTQPTMEYCVELLEAAARHNLLVNFHGATVPRGWQRTYPNLVSTEGVYGAEWYNNNGVLTDRAAAHNATLPFTRNVVGPMDYTPCTFSDSQHPHITSHGHELALTVLFESTVQHLADKPDSYLSQPAAVQEFLTGLPTAWDETKLLDGYPGKYVVMARRKGDKWYIAGINGTDSSMTLPLDIEKALGLKGKVSGRLYTDSGKAAEPWSISDIRTLPGKITIQPRGGFIITL